MSELKKPTIEGLVEKLLEGNHIEENEAGTVQALLEQASNGLNKDEIFTLVTKLNAKLDAHTSDLITPNGLNYSVFESEVKTVAQVINKEKIQREKSQTQATVEPLQEKKDIEKTPQEKAEQTRIEDNKRSIKDLFSSIPELNGLDLEEEDYEDFAKSKTNLDKAIEKAEEKMKKNPELSKEDALKEAAQEQGVDMNSGAIQIAIIERIKEDVQIKQKAEGISIDDAFYKLVESDSSFIGMFVKNDIIEAEKQGKRITFADYVKTKLFSGLEKYFDEKSQESNSEIESLEKDGYYLDVQELRNRITLRETRESRSSWLKKNKNYHKEENQHDFTEITEKYLCTDKSISQLYEELKREDPKLELKFCDVLDGVIENLKTRNNDSDSLESLKKLKKAENEIRIHEQFVKSLKVAQNYSKSIGGAKKEFNERNLEWFENSNNLNKKTITKVKKYWLEKVEIDIDKYKEETKHQLDKKGNKKFSRRTIKTLENDRDRVIKDRNEVIKLAKELGISADDAAKKYFNDNPERLKQYNAKERRILLGKGSKKDEEVEISKGLKKLGTFVKKKNDKLISLLNVDKLVLSKKLADMENDIDAPYLLKNTMRELAKVEARLKKYEESNKRIERGTKKKTASDVLNDRLKTEAKKDIFKKYMTTGKSATEILSELNENGNEYKFSIEEIIQIVADGARKHLKKEELKILINSERTIHNKTNELNAFKIRKKNAEEKGLSDWVKEYDDEIDKINQILELHQNRTKEFRRRAKKRNATKYDNNPRIDDNAKTKDDFQNQNESESERITQEHQKESQSKSSLEIGSIETGGEKPNIKAIAQKGKVTPKGVKGMFEKIKALYNAPKKSKQEEQEIAQVAKTTPATSEGIR